MSEMFSDFTKAINDLKPVRVVVVALTLCIVSALFKWVIPTGEYQSQIQTIAIIIFYLMLVLLIVLWAVYIYKQQWDKSRQLECLRNLTLDERKFLTPYIKTDESVISGSGSIPQLLRKKGDNHANHIDYEHWSNSVCVTRLGA